MLTRHNRAKVAPTPQPPSIAQFRPKNEARLYERIQKQTTHSNKELEELMQSLRDMRATLNARPKPFVYQAQTVVLSLHGFSNSQHRNNLVWALRYALKPTMLFCSQVRPNQWEGIMVLSIRLGTLYRFFPPTSETYTVQEKDATTQRMKSIQKHHFISSIDSFVSTLETLLDKFKLSTGVNDLVSWLDVSTVSCIERIERGSHKFGDFYHIKNQPLVFAYENRRREMRDDMDNQRVRDVTGVDFTVGNMLQVVSPAAKGMLLGFFLGVYLSTWLFKPAFIASMYFYVYFKC